VPFKQFVSPLPAEPTAELLHKVYHGLHELAAAAVRSHIESRQDDLELHPSEGGSSLISYNLAMTTTRMAIVPRRKETAILRDTYGKEIGSVSLNGTILAGTLMVKLEEEWNQLRENPSQLDRVLETIGLPVHGTGKHQNRL
jgi:ATP adenylyltransferase